MLPPKLPSDISQKRLVKAFIKVGFVADWSGGKGSHCKLTCPRTKKIITVQNSLFKEVLKDKLKQAETLGYNAAQIMNEY